MTLSHICVDVDWAKKWRYHWAAGVIFHTKKVALGRLGKAGDTENFSGYRGIACSAPVGVGAN
jgi:hypothetical protein